MAVKTIETRAVISAQDKTGATFAQVAQKLKGMEAAAVGVSKRMDGIARGMSAVGRQQAMHADIARRMSSVTPAAASGGFFALSAAQRERALATAAATGAAMAAQAPIVKAIVRNAGANLHERISMANAGMTTAEILDAQSKSLELSRKFKPIAQVDIMEMLRGMRTVVGTYEEAVKIADPLMQLRVITQHINPAADAKQINEDFNMLVRAADLFGATNSKEKFGNFIDAVARMQNTFGDSIKPHQLFEAAQYSRAAATQLSPEFIAGVLPSMIQTMGGSQSGTGLAAFYRALVGGKMSNVAVHELANLGLLNMEKGRDGKPKYISQTKTGDIKGILPGGVVGSDLARTNPYRWVHEILVPALTRKGVTDPGKIAETVAHMFSNQMSAQLVTGFINNKAAYERDLAAERLSKGREAADEIMSKDLGAAFKGLSNQIDGLAAAAGKPFLEPLIAGIDKLSQITGKATEIFQKNENTAAHGTLAALGLGALGTFAVGKSALGMFGIGAGFSAAALPTAIVGATAGAGLYASWAYREFEKRAAAVDAIFADRSPAIDRSPEALRQRVSLRQMAAGRAGGWTSGFVTSRKNWARGDAPGSIAPGALAFGFGAAGMNDNMAGQSVLRRAPRNPAAEARSTASELANALKNAPPQKIDVNVTAEPMKIETTTRVEASSELLRVVDGAKTAAREAKLSAKASGPGTTGSTDFGNQH